MRNAPIISILSIFLFFSCQKEEILTPTTPPIVITETATDRAAPFEFTIQKNLCLLKMVNVKVAIDNPQLYGYLWEVNDRKGGHLQQMEGCHCGTTAAVTVVRLSDGIRVRRSTSLPPCGTTPPIVPTVETEKDLSPSELSSEVK